MQHLPGEPIGCLHGAESRPTNRQPCLEPRRRARRICWVDDPGVRGARPVSIPPDRSVSESHVVHAANDTFHDARGVLFSNCSDRASEIPSRMDLHARCERPRPIQSERLRHLVERIAHVEDEARRLDRLSANVREIDSRSDVKVPSAGENLGYNAAVAWLVYQRSATIVEADRRRARTDSLGRNSLVSARRARAQQQRARRRTSSHAAKNTGDVSNRNVLSELVVALNISASAASSVR